jgi:hypothetical protein
MLHPRPAQSACLGILASSPSLLPSHSISPTRPGPSQRGQIRVSRLDPIQSRPESAGSIRVSRLDPSRPPRSEPTRTDPSLCPSYPEFGLSVLPYVPAMMGTGQSPVHCPKGVRGYRAIARRRQRGRRRRRPAASPRGRCAARVQVPRSAACGARLGARAAGPEIPSSAAACGRARVPPVPVFHDRDATRRSAASLAAQVAEEDVLPVALVVLRRAAGVRDVKRRRHSLLAPPLTCASGG